MRRLTLVALLGLWSCDTAEPLSPPARAALRTALTVDSTGGCRIDDDCADATFCFQGRCVAECADDGECPAASRCSPRSRCVVEAAVGDLDQSAAAASTEELRDITFTGWPDDGALPVADGAPFVNLTLTTSAPVPGGRLLYSTILKDGATLVSRAEGTTEFTLQVPSGAAAADVPRVQSVTVTLPGDARQLFMTPTRPVGGWYAGTFNPVVFGGASLPLELVVQTEPERVLKLEDASAAWLWVPTSPEYLLALPGEELTRPWVRQPLTWDASVDAWVAVFSDAVAPARVFGPGAFPLARRAMRFELRQSQEGELRGAVADRWRGLFDQRSADGVREAGVATVAGTFALTRTRAVPSLGLVRDGVLDTALPPQQSAPSLSDCAAADFEVPVVAPETVSACDDTRDAASFSGAPAPQRAACALAVSAKVLSGPTVGKTLNALLDPDVADPPGVTFRSFIEDCARSTSATCKPTPALLCARALVATAFLDADAATDDVQRLSSAYDALTKEAFLGRQLAAFQVDTATRLKWLQASEAPAFLASTLRDYNEEILSRWRSEVLEAHLASLFGQLDAAGLAVLTRSPTDPVAQSNRRALLLDLTNSWRAALDGVVLLATRWNVLLQDDASRVAAANELRHTTARLYVAAAMLQVLAREAGASGLASVFGPGFANLQRELNRLALPFNVLLFARDAEVVTSRSVDPTKNANSLLAEREVAARAAVRDAMVSVDLVLDEAQSAQVDETVLAARYEDQLLSLRNELIALCGLPDGCTAAEVGQDDACAVATTAGVCGFVRPRGGGGTQTPSTSEAGVALLSLREAALAFTEAGQRRDARAQQASLLGATAISFAEQVERWHQQRVAVNQEINVLVAEIGAINDEAIRVELEAMVADQRVRELNYSRQQAALDAWDEIRTAGIASDAKKLRQISSLNIAASVMGQTADRIDLLADILVDAQPSQMGTTTDVGAWMRLTTRLPAYVASSALLLVAEGVNTAASILEVNLQADQALREAELTALEQLPDLDEVGRQNDLARLQNIIDASNLATERQVHTLRALIETRRRQLELELVHERDLVEVSDRRDAWRMALIDVNALDYAVLQSELTVRQRQLAYFQVVQRAELLESRFASMQQRYGSLQSLLGSPDVIFSFAARMARAESRIDRARTALEHWLVALEYYAVRPFVDQRMAIMLARNPSQLEAIANEFLRLQRACGGPATVETVELSLRDDLLAMGFDTAGPEGAQVSAAERLRAVLQKNSVQLSPRIPFSATQTLGQRLDSGDTSAVGFALSASGFANLGLSCNAKLESVAVQVVGEGFSGQPVVSVVYDGGGQLRSCQSNIRALVSALGPGTTNFSTVTSFKTSGRTVNPISGINGSFGESVTWNATLEGLPLAAGYALVIDRAHPSNQDQPWDRLEDVRLQIRYSYQDVFPEGQCQ